MKLYGVEKNKIDVVYNGANESFKPVEAKIKSEIKNKYTSGSLYFIFVGSLHPRKNLARLFTAFDVFKKTDQQNIKLLIVGEKKWWTPEINEAFEKMDYKQDVVFTGRLSAADLHLVLASALATAYVSYFEGFGIPIVESYFCDVPVITSNVTSMPEVSGDASLLVDPFSVDSIAKALTQIATDKELRASLIEKGRERRKMFSWQ